MANQPLKITSGPFGLFYRPVDGSQYEFIGHCEKDGWKLRLTRYGKTINTAFTGEAPMDILYGGWGAVVQTTVLEISNLALRNMIYDANGGYGNEGIVHSNNYPLGRAASSFVGQLIARPFQFSTAGQYNALAGIAGAAMKFRITLENGSDVERMMNLEESVIPLTLRVLPFRKIVSQNDVQIRLFDWVNETMDLSQCNFPEMVN